MNISLLAKTQLTKEAIKRLGAEGYDDTKIVAFSAIRTCYSHLDPNTIFAVEKDKFLPDSTHVDEQGKRGADALIKHIARSGHTSTLEHINYTFSIEGVSRSLLAQLTRHRHFSYSVQSQRYVTFSSTSKSQGATFVTPDSIKDNVEAQAIYEALLNDIQTSYDALKALGIASEDARYVLPNAASCNLVLTGNLRSILEFYSKRHDRTHAQTEIRVFAEKLRDTVTESDPWTFDFFDEINKR